MRITINNFKIVKCKILQLTQNTISIKLSEYEIKQCETNQYGARHEMQ